MKTLFVYLLVLLCFAVGADRVRAQDRATTLDSDRYTDVGAGNVRWEQGTLYLDGSYIASTSGVFPASQFGLDAATLGQVSGKPVVALNFYAQVQVELPGYLDNFPRSAATYSINGVPYVTVSTVGGSNPPGGNPGGPAPATLNTDRYTDVGAGNVRWEQGALYADNRFIPQTSGIFPANQFQLAADTLAQVNGQPVIELNLYTQFTLVDGRYLTSFPRSSATFPINGVPYVVVAAGGATPNPPPPASLATPTLSITKPATGSSVPAAKVVIKGTATADPSRSVARVEYKLGAATWTPVTAGTTAWKLTLRDQAPGQIKLKFRAVDSAGTSSTTVKLTLVVQ